MAGNPLNDPNWASDLADDVVRVVEKVRDKTTNNLVLLARGLVFGLLAAILGLMALVLLLIASTRALQSLLELAVEWPRAVYLSYFILGGICCLLGAFMMTKRHSDTA